MSKVKLFHSNIPHYLVCVLYFANRSYRCLIYRLLPLSLFHTMQIFTRSLPLNSGSSTRYRNLSLAAETCNLIGFHPNSEFAGKYGILGTDFPSLVWINYSCLCVLRLEQLRLHIGLLEVLHCSTG